MIDPQIIALAKERITLEIAEQDKQLTLDIEKKKAEMASRGLSRSGNMIAAVQAMCAAAVKDRAALVWEILHRTITTVGIRYDENVERELIAVVEQYFPEHMNGLKYRVSEIARLMGMADLVNQIPDEVGDSRRAAFAKLSTEIRLFVMTLKTTPSKQTYTPQLNIYNSTIGALQTGHQSVAHVNQQINAEGRDALVKALDVIAQELAKVDDLPNQSKTEIIELVAEGRDELVKEKPNLTKIAAYLPTIGNAIAVVANLKPAYDMLKTAALLIGITLP